MKKKFSILLASALMVSSTVTSFGASFADINDVPWVGAATYINEAASLGIMAGEDSNGKTIFRAKDAVTLCETAQIVYNLLKTSQNTTISDDVVTKWTPVMAGYSIPSWAYTAVSYCLENSIVSTSSLSGFMLSDGKSKGASREEVAAMIGKALCLVDSSIVAGSTSTSFNDNAEISSSVAGYIAMLSDKGILSGDDSGNFNPKKTINRAEMAVLTTKSYTVLKEKAVDAVPVAGTASAFVSGAITYGSSVIVSFASGTPSSSYTIDSSVPVSYQDGKAAANTDITAGQLVSITYNGDLVTNVVIEEASPTTTTATTTDTDTVSGKITYLSSTKIKFSGSSTYYYIDDDYLDVTLDDDDDVDLDDLIDAIDDGDTINAEITLDSDDYVIEIEATTEDEDEDEGKISSITTSKIKLTNGSYYYFDDADDVEVALDDDDADVDDLIDAVDDGDTIYVELTIDSDDYVTEIEATTEDEDEDEDEGTISSITTSKIKLKDGSYYYFDDADDVEVTLDDDDADVDDLIDAVDDGDTIYVELTIDSDDYVTEIEATTEDTDEEEGTISYITTSKIMLISGDYYYFDDADDVEVTLDDDDADVDDIIDAVDDGDEIYVELTIDSENYIIEIEATTED
ncbi:MAG: S-layer homology domain-containing protein [Anaerotignaceae bacterium]